VLPCSHLQLKYKIRMGIDCDVGIQSFFISPSNGDVCNSACPNLPAGESVSLPASLPVCLASACLPEPLCTPPHGGHRSYSYPPSLPLTPLSDWSNTTHDDNSYQPYMCCIDFSYPYFTGGWSMMSKLQAGQGEVDYIAIFFQVRGRRGGRERGLINPREGSHHHVCVGRQG
jgi:hypothetical protein